MFLSPNWGSSLSKFRSSGLEPVAYELTKAIYPSLSKLYIEFIPFSYEILMKFSSEEDVMLVT